MGLILVIDFKQVMPPYRIERIGASNHVKMISKVFPAMQAAHPPPSTDPDVNAILAELCAAVHAILGAEFIGMYLYGSLALGDFDPRKSDIDFLVAIAGPLSAEHLASLQAMHRRLAAGKAKFKQELEGSYIPLAALRRYDPADTRHAHIDRGSGALQIEQHDTDWVVQRYSLREYGLALAGPDPRSLIDPISADELRDGVLGLMWWWELQLADPCRVAAGPYQAYTVLSMCRILYTLRHGTLASKPAAARWARLVLEPRWAGLIERALGWQPGEEMNRLDETLDFIRYTHAHTHQEGQA